MFARQYSDHCVEISESSYSISQPKVNQDNLDRAWDIGHNKSSREEWLEWLRNLSLALLKESPSPALRSCLPIANEYPPIAKELFDCSFASCWVGLSPPKQMNVVMIIEKVVDNPNCPQELMQAILNLAESMDRDSTPLNLRPNILAQIAERCQAHAKALHIQEEIFKTDPAAAIDSLVTTYSQLGLNQAASAAISIAQKKAGVVGKDIWFERLSQWDKALDAHRNKERASEDDINNLIGEMRCLHSLGDWNKLYELSSFVWERGNSNDKREVAGMISAAAWTVGDWDTLSNCSQWIPSPSFDSGLYNSILAFHNERYQEAREIIQETRRLIGIEVSPLLNESYSRAYNSLVQAQQLIELEECIEMKEGDSNQINRITQNWRTRLRGCESSIETWQKIISVRSLAFSLEDDIESWIKYSSLCRKNNRIDLSSSIIQRLQENSSHYNSENSAKMEFERLKLLWDSGFKQEAFESLSSHEFSNSADNQLQARVLLKLGNWKLDLEGIKNESLLFAMSSYESSITKDQECYKGWHSWALVNYKAISYYENDNSADSLQRLSLYLVPTIHGLFKAVSLSPEKKSFQDLLRLLNLWFKYAKNRDVEVAISEGLQTVSVETWIKVIPQIIARISSPIDSVRRLVGEIIISIGQTHPQIIIYPLLVASRSHKKETFATELLERISQFYPVLVDQARSFSNELIRCSILWQEQWFEGINEIAMMLATNAKAPYQLMEGLAKLYPRGQPETPNEQRFVELHGPVLSKSRLRLRNYVRTRRPDDLDRAWEGYLEVRRDLEREIALFHKFELPFISPILSSMQDLEIAIPGTYRSDSPVIAINSIFPRLEVLKSKQKPRTMLMTGSDGNNYQFLLKGREDLRQDERVMQLFGLINGLLSRNHNTAKDHLSVQRYSVIPLSHNAGLIGWVPHCDTISTLIVDYRQKKGMDFKLESRIMLAINADYSNLPLSQKVQVFEQTMSIAESRDLKDTLWLKSSNAEMWLDRRTNFTRSIATMSMVGHVLGLGDRHTGNLMIDRYTGKVVHIDFGDCFEVAMQRREFAETVPFRLTRMMVNAMEVCGVEGTFLNTCESTMRVLRENKESLEAVLEAFLYDPIINWRLVSPISPDGVAGPLAHNLNPSSQNNLGNVKGEVDVEKKKAVEGLVRVNRKLNGRDFGEEALDVSSQVRKLLEQATSSENLCVMYIGWCPFW
eukprot:TRINITY_DN6939_c0_g1_i1.p1 TRINITY_DN6939_c0_g1~~TRINITY_DN6939_c0_g1_i1.p1  ORF type:complete len:1242 (+),score=321.13 TRINITY_DN6939_c0_g1_i1:131-3727(+)